METNAYSAEFGRNAGGQIHVVTKSGGNDFSGSVYEYHRNDALDARNFFDGEQKPEFTRNQFGGTVGGPIRKDKTFFFVGSSCCARTSAGRSRPIVPDDAARGGVIPDPRNPGQTLTIPVTSAVRPYLDSYPRANGAALGGGLAAYTFPFDQTLDQQYLQFRLDQNVGAQDQLFVRYTFDDAEQLLPTDFPQFPRTFQSRNHFATAEYRQVSSANTLPHGAPRLRADAHRPAGAGEPGVAARRRSCRGGRSWATSTSAASRGSGRRARATWCSAQKVLGGEYGLVHNRGRHALKAGALVERYIDDMTNPTFSLGIYTFADLESFLRNRSVRFIGLTPEAQLDRNWRFTLFGAYLQDDFRVTSRLTVNAGVRVEYASLPKDIEGRDSTLREPDRHGAHGGPALPEPRRQPVAPRRVRLGRDRRRQDVGARRVRPLLQHAQPAEPDRHRHQPAGHAARDHRQPDVPGAALRARRRELHPPDAVGHPVPARARLEPGGAARGAAADAC